MLSNRTANFKVKDEKEEIMIKGRDVLMKQLTTPLPAFDINFNFSNEEEKENSSFSFKNDLLDKRAYDFIRSKDECLATMELDDSLPTKDEEKTNEDKMKKTNEK